MSYNIVFEKDAKKALTNIDRKIQIKIADIIESLKENPFPIKHKKLKGKLQKYSRVRVGQYRIIYQVLNERIVIIIIRIGLRKDVYRNLK